MAKKATKKKGSFLGVVERPDRRWAIVSWKKFLRGFSSSTVEDEGSSATRAQAEQVIKKLKAFL